MYQYSEITWAICSNAKWSFNCGWVCVFACLLVCLFEASVYISIVFLSPSLSSLPNNLLSAGKAGNTACLWRRFQSTGVSATKCMGVVRVVWVGGCALGPRREKSQGSTEQRLWCEKTSWRCWVTPGLRVSPRDSRKLQALLKPLRT